MKQDNPYLVSLGRDLGNLHTCANGASYLCLNTTSDVTVVVRGQMFLLNRDVLSSHSAYFHTLFMHDKSQIITVELDDHVDENMHTNTKRHTDNNMKRAFAKLVSYFYSHDEKDLICVRRNLKSTLDDLKDFLQVNEVETRARGHGDLGMQHPYLPR